MNVTPEVCHESAWASVRTASKAQVLALQHYFDRRSLEGKLAALTEAARGHKAQGDPAGSAVYVVLHREALLLTEAYSRRWGTDTATLVCPAPRPRDAASTLATQRTITLATHRGGDCDRRNGSCLCRRTGRCLHACRLQPNWRWSMTTAILILELALAVAWWLTRRRSAAMRSLGSAVRERAAARFLARRIAPYTWVASSWERNLARSVATAAASVVQTEGFRHLVLATICHLRSRRAVNGGSQ